MGDTMTQRPPIDRTDQGEQPVLPGAERLTDKEIAERRMAAPLRPTVPQRPADFGLFGSDHLQMPLPLERKGGNRP